MNLLHTLKELFHSGGPPFIPNLSLPPPTLAKTEPSCFAKGIAESIRTEPKQWKTVLYTGFRTTGWYHVLAIEHAKTKAHLEGQSCSYGEDSRYHRLAGCRYLSSIHITDHPLSDADCVLIAQTLEAHPVGQLKTTIEANRKQAALQEAALAHFTTLGCPPTS